jgi:hypothetical protein
MSENGDGLVVDTLRASKIVEEVFEDRTAGFGRPAGSIHSNGLIFQKTLVS